MASRVSASNSSALHAVLTAVAKTAARLCEARDAQIALVEGDHLRHVVHYGLIHTGRTPGETYPLGPGTPIGHALSERRIVHIRDMARAVRTRYPEMAAIRGRSGSRTVLAAPLLRDGTPVGGIVVRRRVVRPFTAKQIALLKTFADQAALAIENARLTEQLEAQNRTLTEALEQQTATSEILRVISSSPTQLQPVLDAVAENAARLCEAEDVSILEENGGVFRVAAVRGASRLMDFGGTPVSRASVAGRAMLDGQLVHVHDITEQPEAEFPLSQTVAHHFGHRTMLATPLLREGAPIGVIFVRRTEVRPFSEKQVGLLQTFADQAVIAIENGRLFTELQARNRDLTEALEQQTATSDILRVISSSPTDVQPVFEAIAESAARLRGGMFSSVFRFDGELLHLTAHHNYPAAALELSRRLFPTAPSRRLFIARAILERDVVYVPDVLADHEHFAPELVQGAGFRSTLAVPMLRGGDPIGAILVSHAEVGPFTEKHIALLQTFADQAVIAIENVRLFTELQASNRDLTEALEQQTATAEILRVISRSPTDLQPVLDAVAQNAARVCGAHDALIRLREGDVLRLVAHYGPLPGLDERIPLTRGSATGRAVSDRQVVHILAAEAENEFPVGKPLQQRFGHRTVLAMPLLREGAAIGGILIRRQEVRPFSDKQVHLLQTFADQAVIAIENVRLFKELEVRNRDLTEALEQQTATADILRVISSSPTNLQPVFDTILTNATTLCAANLASLWLYDGEALIGAAHHNASPEFIQFIRDNPQRPSREGPLRRAAFERQVVHVVDLMADPSFKPQTLHLTEQARTVLAVPLLRENTLIGVIGIWRREVEPFTDAQIALVKTFADQAVIAIENVRLFTELQARNRDLTEALEQQTATGEILGVISSSPTDIQPVFDTIVRSAVRLCDAIFSSLALLQHDRIHLAAHHNFTPEGLAAFQRRYPLRLDRDSLVGQTILERAAVHAPDVEQSGPPTTAALGKALGYRCQLAVPLLREANAIGAIAVFRRQASPFSDSQIQLLKTFADQAVIAIENVRLFTELQEKNQALTQAHAQVSEALEQQTATAEILRVISSSPTDLQPVLDAVAERAARLCSADDVNIHLVDGEMLRLTAGRGPIPTVETRPIIRTRIIGRAVLERRTIHVLDVQEAREEFPDAAIAGVRTALATPLLREGVAIGVIHIRRLVLQPFSEKQIRLLETFADQAVIAIENVRLFKELQERNQALTDALERQTATSEILGIISQSHTDTQPVFDAIIRSAVRLCTGTSGSMVRVEGDMMYLWAHYDYSPEAEELVTTRYPAPISERSLVALAVRTRAPVHAPDLLNDPRARQSAYVQASGVRAQLTVPLLRGDEAIGTLNVLRNEPGPFSESQIDLLQTFAAQAVIAIENMRLFNELQARTAQLTRSVEQLTALGEVSRALGSTLDLETILQTIVARANQLAGTDACSVSEYDEAAEEFRLLATNNLDEEVVAVARRTPIRRGEGVQGRMALTRQPVQIPDIATADAYHGPLRDVLLRSGTRALLAIPLLREDHLVGSLTVTRKTSGEFSPEVIDLLQTFATQSALAIQNARLFREIEDQSRQLEIASRHKSQFLANMSHELRTPLNAILGYTELIVDNIYGEVPEKMREVLERVEKSGRHLLGLINDILDLSKIEAGQLTLALNEYAMQDVVRSVAAATEPLARAKGLGLEVAVHDDLPIGRADERRLMQVLLNLVGNAIKFTETGKVAIRAEVSGDAFHVAVADTGPGIAESEQGKIFEEFQQADSVVARAKGGTGLGLAIARRIIEMHGGRLWLESTVGVGSTFTFTVPVRVEQQVVVTPRRSAS